MSTDEDVLDEQISYYKARAHECDEWWQSNCRETDNYFLVGEVNRSP